MDGKRCRCHRRMQPPLLHLRRMICREGRQTWLRWRFCWPDRFHSCSRRRQRTNFPDTADTTPSEIHHGTRPPDMARRLISPPSRPRYCRRPHSCYHRRCCTRFRHIPHTGCQFPSCTAHFETIPQGTCRTAHKHFWLYWVVRWPNSPRNCCCHQCQIDLRYTPRTECRFPSCTAQFGRNPPRTSYKECRPIWLRWRVRWPDRFRSCSRRPRRMSFPDTADTTSCQDHGTCPQDTAHTQKIQRSELCWAHTCVCLRRCNGTMQDTQFH